MVGAAQEMRAALAAAADPNKAETLARYFQVGPGGYGAGDRFLGVQLGTIRTLLRPHRGTPFVAEQWLPLLRSQWHEERLTALVAMSGRAERGEEAEHQRIYQTYLAHTDRINNWDLVDVSAAPIVGGWLLTRDRTPLDVLAASPQLWERRIAVVATHRLIRAGQTADTYRLALALRADRHDLIHKAVGWMLREAGRRHPAELRGFLDRHAPELPRTTLRYAIEHLPPEGRAHYRGLR